MSKWDKLIVSICNLSKDLRFDEQIVESEAEKDEDTE